MGRKEDNIKKATEVMHILPQIRNLCIAAHIDHGKTTLSDNLIAGAGMMSSDLAGAARVLDFDEQESARGITINAASASMVHAVEGTQIAPQTHNSGFAPTLAGLRVAVSGVGPNKVTRFSDFIISFIEIWSLYLKEP